MSYGSNRLPSEISQVAYTCTARNCPSYSGSTFGYDKAGNLTSESATGAYQPSWTWTYKGDNTVSSGPQGAVTYDSQNRVTSPGGYSYAPNGEMLTSSSGTSVFSYNTSLELKSITNNSASPATVTSFGYTADGQRCWEVR